MHRMLLSAVLPVSVLLSPFAAAQDAEYTFTTINVPFPDSQDTTDAWGINTSGQIVGRFYAAEGRAHGYLKDGTTFTRIEVPDTESTEANGINDVGQVVGTFFVGTRLYGFRKDGDTFRGMAKKRVKFQSLAFKLLIYQ
jgi:uncharacterized membrane protein